MQESEMQSLKVFSWVSQDKGNRLFADDKFEEAIEAFSEAISLAKNNPILYSNSRIID